MAKGWDLYGDPSYAFDAANNVMRCAQAVTKEVAADYSPRHETGTAIMAKTNPGRFFEDYSVGQVLHHAVPRTVTDGERALYHALYPARHALYSSDEFARAIAACRKARLTIWRPSTWCLAKPFRISR